MSEESPTAPTFAEATAVKQLSSHTYSATFHHDWCIGNVPHGGFVTSIFLRVAQFHFDNTLSHLSQPCTSTLHLSFLRRTQVGPAIFTVKDVKLGRLTSTIHITLRQPSSDTSNGDSDDLILGYLTHTSPPPSSPTYPTSWRLTPPPLPISLATLTPSPSTPHLLSETNWTELPSFPFSSFRRASKRCRWLVPKVGQRPASQGGYMDQWICLKGDDERWDTESLGFLADMFPQVLEAMVDPTVYDPPGTVDSAGGFSGGLSKSSDVGSASSKHWYPTLVLNLDIRKPLPPAPYGPRFLFSRVLTKQVKDGRYDLEVVIIDEEGDLVALSHHVCLVLPAARNLAVRGGSTKERAGKKSSKL